MKYKIVSDSASNIHTIEDIPFSYAPLHIIVGDRDFSDDDSLDQYGSLFRGQIRHSMSRHRRLAGSLRHGRSGVLCHHHQRVVGKL